MKFNNFEQNNIQSMDINEMIEISGGSEASYNLGRNIGVGIKNGLAIVGLIAFIMAL
jgi:hypothetical protein